MTTLDTVSTVVNCISLKASPSSHTSHISHAVNSLTAANNDVTLVSSSWECVSSNKSLLSLSSPFLRDLLSSIPCCISATILLPDFSTHTVKHLVSIITNGFTTSHLGNGVFSDINQVIDMAKMLEIAIADPSCERKNSENDKQIDIKVELLDGLDQQMPVIESCKSLQTDEDFIKDEMIMELSEKEKFGLSFTTIPKATNNEAIQKDIDIFPCKECGKEFNSMSKLKAHKVFHNKISLSRQSLEENRNASTKETVKEFTCNICGRTLARKSDMKRHMNIHTGVKPYRCETCGKTFSTKSNKNKHSLNVKCKPGEAVRESSNGVHNKALNIEQINLKTNEDVGQKQNPVRNELSEGKENYEIKCYFCRKIFSSTDSLNEHLNDGCEKPYKCPFCPAQFFHFQHVNRHVKVKHPDESYNNRPSEKSYQCPQCPTKFYYKGSIKKHVKNKHWDVTGLSTVESKINKSEEEYKCCYCSKVFLKEKYMKVHKKKCQVRLFKETKDIQKENQQLSVKGNVESVEIIEDQELSVKGNVESVEITDCPKFQCPFCTEEFKLKEAWEWHIDVYHNTSDDD